MDENKMVAFLQGQVAEEFDRYLPDGVENFTVGKLEYMVEGVHPARGFIVEVGGKKFMIETYQVQ